MIKLVLVGATGIGKSNLAKYLAYEKKMNDELVHVPTVGADIMYIKDRKICVYDMAGEPRFERISESFVRKADILAFCFSRDDVASYQYINELYKRYSSLVYDKIILYIETKCDLDAFTNYEVIVDKQRVFQTSSKTGIGRDELLNFITQHISAEEDELTVHEEQFCGNCDLM